MAFWMKPESFKAAVPEHSCQSLHFRKRALPLQQVGWRSPSCSSHSCTGNSRGPLQVQPAAELYTRCRLFGYDAFTRRPQTHLHRPAAAIRTADQVADKSSDETGSAPQLDANISTTYGRPEVNRILAQTEVYLKDVAGAFPFELDPHQRDAISMVMAGYSLVVSAPTGSGKTAIAEAATMYTLARHQRVIYTTPLKALSNQKLYEFRRMFGSQRAGLQTGDASLNAEGDVVVMTTEVMRNIMYRSAHDSTTGRSGTMERLADVGLLVLDEVHYLGNPSRGSVWEEVIINCPPHIQILAMSATIANADELGEWINQVHGSCRTLVSMVRPIPLSWRYCYADNTGATAMRPLLDRKSHRAVRDAVKDLRFQQALSDDTSTVAGARSRLLDLLEQTSKLTPVDESLIDMPDRDDVVRLLKREGMLPAIWFIFSRTQCDTAALQMQQAGLSLVNASQRAAIRTQLTRLRQEQPEAVRERLVPALLEGIASHHAGSLPGWKSLIELLFQQGMLQLVFATETLAAGINMPARSTVLSAVSRRRDDGPAHLSHNELLQMAGRAGFCVMVHHRREGSSLVSDLLRRGPERLQSQFASGYGMALNLLFSRSLAQAREFIGCTFDNYLSGDGRLRKEQLIRQLMEQEAMMLQAAEQAETAAGGAEAAWGRYTSLQAQVRECKRTRRTILAQALTERSTEAQKLLAERGLPCPAAVELEPLAALTGSNSSSSHLAQPLAALMVAELDPPAELTGKASFLSQSWYLCLSEDNRLMKVRAEHVSHIGSASAEDAAAASRAMSAATKAGTWIAAGAGAYFTPGPMTTAALAASLGGLDNLDPLHVHDGFLDSLDALEGKLAAMRREMKAAKQAAGSKRSVRQDLDLRAKAAKLRKRIRAAKQDMEQQATYTWRAFEDVVAVLVAAAALEPNTLKPTVLGQVARDIHGNNQLWLAIVLSHNATQALTASQLGGLLGAMVASDVVGRPHISAAYSPSAPIIQTVEALEPARSRLFDLQDDARLTFPLEIDLRPAGIVEAWAAGSTWDQIMADCNLDDGDVARLLSRTVDLLRQAGHCQALPPALRRSARSAAAAMTRAPISELVS